MKNVQIYNKAVRDGVPDAIRAEGGTVNVLKLDPDDFAFELGRKLSEEVSEFQEAHAIGSKLEELADVLAIVRALAPSVGGWDALLAAEKEKADAKGAFNDRQYLVTVITPE